MCLRNFYVHFAILIQIYIKNGKNVEATKLLWQQQQRVATTVCVCVCVSVGKGSNGWKYITIFRVSLLKW